MLWLFKNINLDLTQRWHLLILGEVKQMFLLYFPYYVLIKKIKYEENLKYHIADDFITVFSELNISRTYAYATHNDKVSE